MGITTEVTETRFVPDELPLGAVVRVIPKDGRHYFGIILGVQIVDL